MDSDVAHSDAHDVQSGLKGFRKRWRESASSCAGSVVGLVESAPFGNNSADGPLQDIDTFPDCSNVDTDMFGDWDHVTMDDPMNEPVGLNSVSDRVPTEVSSAWGAPDYADHDLKVEDPEGLESGWKQAAMTVASKRAKLELPKMPWDEHPMKFIFRGADQWAGTVVSSLKDVFIPTALGCKDVLESVVVREHQEDSKSVRAPPVSKLKLRSVRYETPDEDIRRVALSKLQDIILQDPLATQLGSSLHKMVSCGSSPGMVVQSLSDCFRSKASSTLQKRAGSLTRLAKIMRQHGFLEPLRMTEEQMYVALCFLRQSGAGATAAQHIIESVFFLDSTAKLILIDVHSVVSGRCRGVARDMFLTKDPLAQKHPFSVAQVRELEVQMSLVSSEMKCILGQILFCIHACCRWKDSQRLKALSIETAGGETLIFADALSSKTALTAEAKTRYLPYAALGSGVTGDDWAHAWLEARDNELLSFGEFALPSFSERNAHWTSNPMSASEATYWLREFLTSLADRAEAVKFGSHSCKTTLLTWIGRSTIVQFSAAERRLAGHHLDPGMKSVMCYSREAYTSLYAKILSMVKLIRTNVFNPDLPAVERIVQMSKDFQEEPQIEVPNDPVTDGWELDSESSIASEPDLTDLGQSEAADSYVPDFISLMLDFPGARERDLLVHIMSGIVHVVNEDDVFLCGRRSSINFRQYEAGDENADHYEGCRQCKKVFAAKECAKRINEVNGDA